MIQVDNAINRAWSILHRVTDPEIPVISVCDLGIVREICAMQAGIEVVLTPTYSGCPATEQIEHDIRAALEHEGLGPIHIRIQHLPAWSTDWISEIGKQKLRAYGITPPGKVGGGEQTINFVTHKNLQQTVICPHCQSEHTELLAPFGSTACKALYRCLSCREPFEYFKAI